MLIILGTTELTTRCAYNLNHSHFTLVILAVDMNNLYNVWTRITVQYNYQ